jgi:hypothetical protein
VIRRFRAWEMKCEARANARSSIIVDRSSTSWAEPVKRLPQGVRFTSGMAKSPGHYRGDVEAAQCNSEGVIYAAPKATVRRSRNLPIAAHRSQRHVRTLPITLRCDRANRAIQTPMRKRVITTMIATCIIPCMATA